MSGNNEIIHDLVKEYFLSGKLLHLATSFNSNSWLCHVWYAIHEENKSIIYTSNRLRRHSQEIFNNPKVAGGVVAVNLEGLGQKVRGLSFEGTAAEASESELENIYESYALRWPQVRSMFSTQDILSKKVDMRMYCVKFTKIVLFDEVNFPSSPRQELFF
jgi:uncharacterized protein YhbP (UPF0306 family)